MVQEIEEILKRAVKSAFGIEIEPKIEIPENEKLGDYSTSIALEIAAKKKESVQKISQEIVDQLKMPYFEKITIAGPGFINFWLSEKYLQNQIKNIIEQNESYGSSNVGQGQKVQIEFISANPTGPLTLGNGRGGFFGDCLANILDKAGYKVEREYYVNDLGTQIEKLGHSVLGDNQAVYQGDYIEDLRQRIKEKNASKVGQKAAQIIMAEQIKPVIENKMKIYFDNWFWESSLYRKGKIEATIKELKKKGLVFQKKNALWFSSKKLGDNQDRVLVREDGQPTYLAADIAYHLNKFVERKFDKVINIWGADHAAQVKSLKLAMKAFGFDKNLEIILMQFVRLVERGKPAKISKRAGIYVTIDELIDQVGLDVVRFFFLMHSVDTHMDFDLDKACQKSEKNPVFYIQYSLARINSILKKLKTQNSELKITNIDLSLIKHPSELKLIKILIRLPDLIRNISQDFQIQKIAAYAILLADAFHRFYEKCRVISPDKQLSRARRLLLQATQIVLKNTLNLMGISTPEKM